MGCGQVVRHLVLVQAFGGSNPSIPAKVETTHLWVVSTLYGNTAPVCCVWDSNRRKACPALCAGRCAELTSELQSNSTWESNCSIPARKKEPLIRVVFSLWRGVRLLHLMQKRELQLSDSNPRGELAYQSAARATSSAHRLRWFFSSLTS